MIWCIWASLLQTSSFFKNWFLFKLLFTLSKFLILETLTCTIKSIVSGLTKGLINKIQLLTNFINIFFVCVLRQFLMFDATEKYFTIISICLNVITLFAFIIIFFKRKTQNRRMSTLYYDSLENTKTFENMCKFVTVNEGKFVFFWVWGANIDYTRSAQSSTGLDSSMKTDDLI